MKAQKKILISEEFHERRLDKWLKLSFPDIPFGFIAKIARKGQIRRDGEKLSLSSRLEAGDEVCLPKLDCFDASTEKHRPPKLSPKSREGLLRNILFEDPDIVVLNKPCGLAVQGGSGVRSSLDEMMLAYAGPSARLVHRLDKSTSGVIVIAKNLEAAKFFTTLFKNREVKKTYFAFVKGSPPKEKGSINTSLVLSDKAQKGSVSIAEFHDDNAKEAKTNYKVLFQCEFEGEVFTLLKVDIETGRKHQIRAHLSSIGLQIVGDRRYGDVLPSFLKKDELCLHAYEITFRNRGQLYQFSAPLSETIKRCAKEYGGKSSIQQLFTKDGLFISR